MTRLAVLRLVIFVFFLHYSLSLKCYFCQDMLKNDPRLKRDDASENATESAEDHTEKTSTFPPFEKLPPCSEKIEKKCAHFQEKDDTNTYCVSFSAKTKYETDGQWKWSIRSDSTFKSADCAVFSEVTKLLSPGVSDICDFYRKQNDEDITVENCHSCQSDLCNTAKNMEVSFLFEIFAVVFSVSMLKIYY